MAFKIKEVPAGVIELREFVEVFSDETEVQLMYNGNTIAYTKVHELLDCLQTKGEFYVDAAEIIDDCLCIQIGFPFNSDIPQFIEWVVRASKKAPT